MQNASRQLRIAMVCDIVPDQVGGSYLSAVRFAALLRERGHHVILIGSRRYGEKPIRDYNGIPYYQFFALAAPGSHHLYYQSFPTKRALRKVLVDERIGIVHVMFPSYSCAVAKKAAKELGLPIVAHIHTQPENVYNFLPSFLKTKTIYDGILRFLVRTVRDAQCILCPSELGKRQYRSIDPSLPITVLSNGVDLAQFGETDVRPFMKKYNLAPERKHLLFVGRLMEEKGVETLVRAIPEIVRGNAFAHLDIVGTGPLMQKLRALAAALGVGDRVTFLGRVSDEDRLAAYNACTLFVLPSHVELEGMVVLEAMACKKPILIANAEMSASKYFVRENGLLFAPDDPHDLATQALRILSDENYARALGERSLSNAKEYDIHKSADELERRYYSVV